MWSRIDTLQLYDDCARVIRYLSDPHAHADS